MKILKLKNNIEKILKETERILKDGGLVIFPSDTVYGLLADAFNEKAVKKLIEFKNRPPGKAISIFVSGFEMIKKLTSINNYQLSIINQILPGPFTVILESKHKVSRLLESERETLGVRYIRYKSVTDLVKRFAMPITATSANLSNSSAHHSIVSLLRTLPQSKMKLIDLIVDAGKLPKNKPSTVVDLTSPEMKVLRRGDFDFLKTEKYISCSEEETKKIAALFLKKIVNNRSQRKPLIFIIEGELGVGKTVFVKGVGECFGINNIISPTFVVYYEYEINKSKVKSSAFAKATADRQKSKFIHLDLYNIQEKEDFKYLGLKNYLKPKNILCLEWGERAGEIYDMLKRKGKIIYVKMGYVDEKKREIIIKN